MKALKKFLLIFILIVSAIFSAEFKSEIAYADTDEYLYVSGEVCGFSLVSNGVSVIGLCDVITQDKTYSPAKEAGVKTGDLIVKINNNLITSDSDIEKYVSSSPVILEVKRKEETLSFVFPPAKDINGKYKLGVFVRNDITGIGTITYYKENGDFSALGHEVYTDNSQKIEIVGGKAFEAGITSIVKGTKGNPGEIQGFLKKSINIGTIYKGADTGIYGQNPNFNPNTYEKIEVAENKEVTIGEAKIISNVSGKKTEYKVSIVKVDEGSSNKNLVIKIDDENLLSISGGIIQGMSGSPIIQKGKIVGAVTHVFINDPTRGYGVLINNILEND